MTANTEPVAFDDRGERERVLAPGASFIVQAPAGSGKTELLIQRYLRLLDTVSHPEEVVAITFTRKAAAEMQGRILRALDQARAGEPVEGYAQATRALADAVLRRDRDRAWNLSDNPRRLRIHTIDSLCARLTRQMPVLSRLGAQPETVEDAAHLYREAAEATLAELEAGSDWSESIALLLARLDNDLPKVRDLIARMLAKRDQWLAHVLQPDRRRLESALEHLVASTLETVRAMVPPDCIDELAALLQYAAAHAEADSPLHACAGLAGFPGTAAADLAHWQALSALLLTKERGWRKRAEKSFGFGAGTKGGWRERYLAVLAQLAEDEPLRRALAEVRRLPPVRYSDAEWELVEALCRLLKLADAQLTVIFAEHNCIDFTGITRAALAALGEEDAPTDLALHLDYQVRHLLVDEFQDISSQQYLLLRRLTAGWMPGDGRTLFLVGDPMQSIYGFREAEVGLYLDTWNGGRLGGIELTPVRITVNFRSRRGIVDWVNDTFSRVLPPVPDVGRGAVAYAPARPFHAGGPDAAVVLHSVGADDEGAEAALVCRLVQDAVQNAGAAGTAVLVRNRTALEGIVPALKAAGLRFRAVEIEPLGHRPAIQDLMALARALAQPADRVAWLAVLRAPWCGLSLADLLAVASADSERTIPERCTDPQCLAALTGQGRATLLRFWQRLAPAFEEHGRRRLRRRVEAAWLRVGGPATLTDATDLENVRACFDLLDDLDAGGELSDARLLAAGAAELFAAPDTAAGDQLQIMTIHKAKGLEFDTVIVPGLARQPRRDDGQLLRWSHRTRTDGGVDLLLAPIHAAGAHRSPIYDSLEFFESERRDNEEGRLMYVAATRARRQLHLVAALRLREGDGAPAAPPAGSLLARLWPAAGADFCGALKSGATAAAAAPRALRSRLRRFPPDWQVPAPAWTEAPRSAPLWAPPGPGAAVDFFWAGLTIQHIGTVVHRLLRRLDAGDPPERAQVESMLVATGVPAEDLGWAADSVQQALAAFRADARGRWLLDPRHREARNEYALSGLHAGRLVNVILDRTFVDEAGTRWIVDYKTSRHEGPDLERFLDQEQERYRQQLERYGAVMRGLDPRPIRLGLYFPLLRGWREWAFGA